MCSYRHIDCLNNRHHDAFAVTGNDRLLFFGDSHAELFSFFYCFRCLSFSVWTLLFHFPFMNAKNIMDTALAIFSNSAFPYIYTVNKLERVQLWLKQIIFSFLIRIMQDWYIARTKGIWWAWCQSLIVSIIICVLVPSF